MLTIYRLRKAAAAAIFAAAAGSAWPLNLSEAVERARQTDPQFLTARANLDAASERADQAFGALLPQVQLSANTNSNKRDYLTKNSPLPPTENRYNTNSAQLTVTQPLFRRSNRIASTQAEAAYAQAEHQFAAAEQDLLVRLGQAWFDVMLSRDIVMFNAGQVAASRNQWEQAQRGSELGLTSGPALEEARTKYDQALAEHAGAQSEYQVKLATLEQIIGPVTNHSAPVLSDEYAPPDPRGTPLDLWLAQAEAQSPSILAAQRALEAAGEEVRKQRAGHDPTLDAVATYSKNEQGTGSFPGQGGFHIKQRALGLQLNIPIFTGGTQNAKVGEAIAMRDKAAQDLEAARRQARLNAKQAWFGWETGMARRTAGMQAMKFAVINLQSAITGKTTGLKMELDVLQARQQLYAALRDLQKARYEMITSQLKLQGTVGALRDTDLIGLDAWLRDDASLDTQVAQGRGPRRSPPISR